jgi:hypothetical protein
VVLLSVPLLSGVVGVGFYPIMGNRVWCRFETPMAAILGYNNVYQNSELPLMVVNVFLAVIALLCEMGIDVRSYAEGNCTFFLWDCGIVRPCVRY